MIHRNQYLPSPIATSPACSKILCMTTLFRYLKRHDQAAATAFAALLGFGGIIAVTAYNGEKDRQMKFEEEHRAAKSVAIALYIETTQISTALRDVESGLDSLKKGRMQLIKGKAFEPKLYCRIIAEKLAGFSLKGMGMAEVQKASLGRLPGKLPFRQLELSLAVDQLTSKFGVVAPGYCQYDSDGHLDSLSFWAQHLRWNIGILQEELWRHYPGFRDPKDLRKDNEAWKPYEAGTSPVTTSSVEQPNASPAKSEPAAVLEGSKLAHSKSGQQDANRKSSRAENYR